MRALLHGCFTIPPRRVAIWAAFLAIAATFASAAPPPPPAAQLEWAGGLDAAKAEAQRRAAPLVVVLNMDNEGGNERMVTDVYTAAAVRDAARRCVVTIASIGTHAETDDGHGRKVCSRFGRVTCAEHRATEEVVRTQWLGKGPKDDVDSPRHIVLSPDGRLLFERVWVVEPEELVRIFDRAVAACVPATLAAWDTTEARLHRIADPLACVRSAALRDLLAARDPAIDARIVELTRKTEDGEVARTVIDGLASDPSPSRTDAIRKLLGAPSAPARTHAAAAIARGGAKDAFDVLTAAFTREKNVDVRCVLLRAATAAGGDAAKTRDFALKHAKAGEDAVRVHAVVALAPWAADAPVVDGLRKWPTNDKVPMQVRIAACWLLGLSGRTDVEPDLRPLVEERNEWLKRAAERAIAVLGGGGKPGPDYLRARSWIAPLSVDLGERQ